MKVINASVDALSSAYISSAYISYVYGMTSVQNLRVCTIIIDYDNYFRVHIFELTRHHYFIRIGKKTK